jgi:predicted nucleic acid-binding protein
MNLDKIPEGSLCVLDTNILLYAEQGASAQAQHLLRRVERGELLGVLPQPVWQELTHKLMLAEALALGEIKGGNPARQLSGNPGVLKRLKLYREKVQALLTLGLKYETCTQTDLLESAFRLQARYGLLTNDSVILAVALRLDADALLSADERFRAVEDITVYWPSDLSLGAVT